MLQLLKLWVSGRFFATARKPKLTSVIDFTTRSLQTTDEAIPDRLLEDYLGPSNRKCLHAPESCAVMLVRQLPESTAMLKDNPKNGPTRKRSKPLYGG